MTLSHQKKMRTLRGFYVGIRLWNDVQTKWFDFLSGLERGWESGTGVTESSLFVRQLNVHERGVTYLLLLEIDSGLLVDARAVDGGTCVLPVLLRCLFVITRKRTHVCAAV
jgi:hypothetical protein